MHQAQVAGESLPLSVIICHAVQWRSPPAEKVLCEKNNNSVANTNAMKAHRSKKILPHDSHMKAQHITCRYQPQVHGPITIDVPNYA